MLLSVLAGCKNQDSSTTTSQKSETTNSQKTEITNNSEDSKTDKEKEDERLQKSWEESCRTDKLEKWEPSTKKY